MPVRKKDSSNVGVGVAVAGIGAAAIIGGVYLFSKTSPVSPPPPTPPPPPPPPVYSLSIVSVSPTNPNTTQSVVLVGEAFTSTGAPADGASGEIDANSSVLTTWGPTDAAGVFTVTLAPFTVAGPYTLQLISGSVGSPTITITVTQTTSPPPPPATAVLTTLTGALASGQAATVTVPANVATLVTALDQNSHPIAATGNAILNGTILTGTTFAAPSSTGAASVSVPVSTVGGDSIQFQAVASDGITVISDPISVTGVASPPPPSPSPPPPPTSPPPPPSSPPPPPPPTSTSPTLTVSAVTTAGASEGLTISIFADVNNTDLIFSAPAPWTYTALTANTTYYVVPDNFPPYTFEQWSDGNVSTNRPITIASGATLSLEAIYTTSTSPPPPPSSSTFGTLIVTSQTTAGVPFTGIEIAVFREAANSNLLYDSYTPLGYGSMTPGVTYYVVAEAFSGYTFSSWSTGSTVNNLPVSAAAGQVVSIVAIYAVTVTPPPPVSVPGYASLSVATTDQDGNLENLKIAVFADLANSEYVASGEAPWTNVTLVGGMTYYVFAEPFSTFTFAYWADNGSTVNNRAISIPVNGGLALTAVYDNSALGTSPPPPPPPPPSTGTATVNVDTVNSSGVTLTGYYIELANSAGSDITDTQSNPYSPVSYALTAGTVYFLIPQDFGNESFSHWQDTGSTTPERQITAVAGTTTYVAVYTP